MRKLHPQKACLYETAIFGLRPLKLRELPKWIIKTLKSVQNWLHMPDFVVYATLLFDRLILKPNAYEKRRIKIFRTVYTFDYLIFFSKKCFSAIWKSSLSRSRSKSEFFIVYSRFLKNSQRSQNGYHLKQFSELSSWSHGQKQR